MTDKLAQLQKLMLEGYHVTSVDSDDDCVLATLRRGDQSLTLRLHRSDAQKLLFSDPLRAYR